METVYDNFEDPKIEAIVKKYSLIDIYFNFF